MKKALPLVLVFVLMLILPSCQNDKQDKKISAAVAELKSYWKDFYSENEKTNGYFEIKNTRVIHIKENDTEEFQDVDCIVEFVLFTDDFGSAPYYVHFLQYDCVVVYRDGTMEVQNNPISKYRATYYVIDYSHFIGSVEDLGGQYNCIEKLK